MAKIEMRSYQKYAVDYGTRYFHDKSNDKPDKVRNGVIILPTGSGKSIVIANLIKSINVPTLVLQPSKEILVQNFHKYDDYGFYATIFSASLGRKEVGMVTFATIGSVIKKLNLFKHIRCIIIDECHLVEPAGGMYRTLVDTLKVKVIGLTATPYRLYSSMQGSELRFITRQRSAIFHDVVYYVQNEMLFEMGFLAKLRYFRIAETDYYDTSKLRKNSNGSDYTDASVRDYHREINFPQKISQMAQRLLNGKEPRKSVLIFVRFLEEAREVVRLNPSFGYVDGKTPQNERDLVLKNFKSGKIKVMINSGVLTTGFDYPELDCVLIARDTMSLALYYQIVGRGIRIHTSKKDTFIVDMCQNINRFGKVEDLKIKLDLKKRYYICGIPNKKEKQLTNCIIA